MISSLLIGNGAIARVTNTNVELKAHLGNGGPPCRTLITNSLPTRSTVMLSLSHGLVLHHSTQVPEEWSFTHLTDIRLLPFRSLCSFALHVPPDQNGILTTRKELLCPAQVRQSGDLSSAIENDHLRRSCNYYFSLICSINRRRTCDPEAHKLFPSFRQCPTRKCFGRRSPRRGTKCGDPRAGILSTLSVL